MNSTILISLLFRCSDPFHQCRQGLVRPGGQAQSLSQLQPDQEGKQINFELKKFTGTNIHTVFKFFLIQKYVFNITKNNTWELLLDTMLKKKVKVKMLWGVKEKGEKLAKNGLDFLIKLELKWKIYIFSSTEWCLLGLQGYYAKYYGRGGGMVAGKK